MAMISDDGGKDVQVFFFLLPTICGFTNNLSWNLPLFVF